MGELQDFCTILRGLQRRAGNVYLTRHETLQPIVEAIAGEFTSVTREMRDIPEILARDRRVFMVSRRSYLNLPVIIDGRNSVVPIASLDVDFTANPPTVHVTIVQFLFDSDDTLCGIGARFETPSGSGGGVHDFYHAQLVRALGRSVELPRCPKWLPESQPSFPLDASSPVELLVCAIGSTYGARMFGELERYAPCIVTRAKAMKLGALMQSKDQGL